MAAQGSCIFEPHKVSHIYFKTTSNVTLRRELLVLLTLRVVRSPCEARAVTDELRGRLRGLKGLEGTPRIIFGPQIKGNAEAE